MLEITWFLLWGLLWAIYFILDGFDLGLGTLLPFLGKNEHEKRVILNSAGPFWDGNEVWLITAGGVTFAAFPTAYAIMFSSLYAPLLIILFALIFRAVSFEFRSKEDHPLWAIFWDKIHFISNIIPSILFGVTFANLFMGIPIDANGVYHGSILMLLSPYGLTGGIFFLIMFSLHGALWLAFKSEENLQIKALSTIILLWPIMFILLLLFLILTAIYTDIYTNYLANPILFIVPIIAFICFLGIRYMLNKAKILLAFACSGLYILGITFFGILGMFPNIVKSNMNDAWSITAYNAASSPLTLKIMLGVTLVCIPIVLAYQAWIYVIFSGKVTKEDLEDDHAY